MLPDKELDQAAANLADFGTASHKHHQNLDQLIQNYTTLLGDYRRLKSDYEEERESRERYKQMARGQERNPFVLVLLDGDGYVFDDDLVSNGAEGGQRAASLLNDMVKSSLRNRGLEHCRIMVRVYANLAGLSKALSKSKLAGPEKRSLAPFTASFTRSNDLFDFVDAGELKENADFKIRAMFRQFAENAQCRHIYFGGCHDVGYISELTPYAGNRDRITLVRTPAFHPEFSKLGIRIEDFPNIFRTMPLDGQVSVPPFRAQALRDDEPAATSPVDSGVGVCAFYQKGLCKYGNGCRLLHVKATTNGTTPSTAAGSLSDIRDWRQGSGINIAKPASRFPMSQLSRSDNDFMNNTNNALVSTDPQQLRVEFAATLPQVNDIPPNEIPINKLQHRLDAYIQPPTHEERAAFQARIAIQKLCNNHHLNGRCPNGDMCEYDHSPIPKTMLNCLMSVARHNPCPRKGACRNTTCQHGHICQTADCIRRGNGGKVYCKFGVQAHCQPLETMRNVSGIGAIAAPRDDVESAGHHGELSSKASTSPPPTPEGRGSLQQQQEQEQPAGMDDSDEELEQIPGRGGQGAPLNFDGGREEEVDALFD